MGHSVQLTRVASTKYWSTFSLVAPFLRMRQAQYAKWSYVELVDLFFYVFRKTKGRTRASLIVIETKSNKLLLTNYPANTVYWETERCSSLIELFKNKSEQLIVIEIKTKFSC